MGLVVFAVAAFLVRLLPKVWAAIEKTMLTNWRLAADRRLGAHPVARGRLDHLGWHAELHRRVGALRHVHASVSTA